MSLCSIAAAPVLISLAILPLGALLYPKLEFAGVMRAPIELNNQGCTTISGLEACEDAWISESNGLAYLPCSDRDTRLNWLPAMLHLNATALPTISTDYIALLNLETSEHSKIKLENTPAGWRGLYTHAIDSFEEDTVADAEGQGGNKKLNVFLNSHVPPKVGDGSSGAESVIEIFEGELGKNSLSWVKSVSHELIRTPNNLAVVGPRQFYFSNDHKRKAHWSRQAEALYAETSDIIYCDASGAEAQCIVAASDLIYPNGVTKGPGQLIYSASSLAGNIRMWERQNDHTLVLIDEVILPRPTDNIHVSTSGSIYAATFPKILEFITASSPAGYESGHVSPVEVWKVSNETTDAKFFGGKYKVETVFADVGKIVSGATTAAPYKNKVLLTGVWTKDVQLCTLP